MTNYTEITPWRTGDVVSATKLTQMTDNLAYVTGLYNQRHNFYDSGADVIWDGVQRRRRELSLPGKMHDAWICHNGDRLVVNVEIYQTDNTVTATYDKGGDNAQVFTLVNGDNVLQLNTNGFYQFEPVRIRVESAHNEGVWVRYIYQTNSNLPSWGTLPAFTNGTASSAADLNALVLATDKARQCFEQPISSAYYFQDGPTVEHGFQGYVRRSHQFVTLNIVATGERDGVVHLSLNNQGSVWTYPLSSGSLDTVVSYDLTNLETVPAVGDWYPVEIKYDPYHDIYAVVYLWEIVEQPGKTYANFDTMNRWSHGDLVDGDALSVMTGNLVTLNTNRHWVNIANRVAHRRIGSPSDNPPHGRYSARRVYRWLAYEPFEDDLGNRDTSPQVLWTSAGRTLQSYSLPVAYQPSFFDLESTPIKPGMYMRFTGLKYAIQVPEVPGGIYA